MTKYGVYRLNVGYTKTSKAQMLGTEANNSATDLMYYKRFVELFPALKSGKPNYLAFFVERRERFVYMKK